MVSSKIIGGIAAGVVIAIAVAFASGSLTDGADTGTTDGVAIIDDVDLVVNDPVVKPPASENPDFVIDESGNKRYTISAVDKPDIVN